MEWTAGRFADEVSVPEIVDGILDGQLTSPRNDSCSIWDPRDISSGHRFNQTLHTWPTRVEGTLHLAAPIAIWRWARDVQLSEMHLYDLDIATPTGLAEMWSLQS